MVGGRIRAGPSAGNLSTGPPGAWRRQPLLHRGHQRQPFRTGGHGPARATRPGGPGHPAPGGADPVHGGRGRSLHPTGRGQRTHPAPGRRTLASPAPACLAVGARLRPPDGDRRGGRVVRHPPGGGRHHRVPGGQVHAVGRGHVRHGLRRHIRRSGGDSPSHRCASNSSRAPTGSSSSATVPNAIWKPASVPARPPSTWSSSRPCQRKTFWPRWAFPCRQHIRSRAPR
jgi:hypothetical protein